MPAKAFSDYIKEAKVMYEMLLKFKLNFSKSPKERLNNRMHLQNKIQSLQTTFKNFEAAHIYVLRVAEESDHSDPYFTDDTHTKAIEIFDELFITINNHLEILANNVNINNNDESINNTCTKQRPLKLPKINIPNFCGDYLQWRPFHDLFSALIHNNSNLSSVEKFFHLKSSLSGEAAQLLSHFQATNENYEAAWDSLVTRYENNRLLVNAQLRILTGQPTIHRSSPAAIKNLIDTICECRYSLINLGVNVETWDPIINYLICQRLDKETHRLWEQSLSNPTMLPSFKDLSEFLTTRFQSLEMLTESKPETSSTSDNTSRQTSNNSFRGEQNQHKKSFVSTNTHCVFCNEQHSIFSCKNFLSQSESSRLIWARENSRCTNCLRTGHTRAKCTSKNKCLKCKKLHHTLLHLNSPTDNNHSAHAATNSNSQLNQISTEIPTSADTPALYNYYINESPTVKHVLLATALINAKDSLGNIHRVRAFLDQGSQASFVTERLAQRLRVKKTPTNIPITGLGVSKAAIARSTVTITLSSIYENNFTFNVNALTLSKITNLLPSQQINHTNWNHLENLKLADPFYHEPSEIDLLLGADIYSNLLLDGIIKGLPGAPTAQNTQIGWILSGVINEKSSSISSMHINTQIDEQLKRFFESEDVNTDHKRIYTPDEQRCEEIYTATTSRDHEGRYIVALPVQSNNKILGESRNQAYKRFLHGENKRKHNPAINQSYITFMREYTQLKHMRKIIQNNAISPKYYLPHHSIVRAASTTTKIRVVFDGSAKTHTGISLNNKLLTGPTIQDDLMSIVMRWRKHKIAIKADIAKMYRQILIREEDIDYQRILWRESHNEDIEEYQLLTVTYGTSCAPYLAIRTLHQLAHDDGHKFPLAKLALLSDFYVDDVMTGSDSIDEAIDLQNQLSELLIAGGFPLRKWASNTEQILKNVPPEHCELQLPFQIDADECIKTLGIYWHSTLDVFEFKINHPISDAEHTKRSFLSSTAKLFDPLGWLAPTIIIVKILFQKLWIAGINWDDPLPSAIREDWLKFQSELPELEKIKIPRWIGNSKNQISCQIHGFCDSSISAYAAVIFIRTVNEKFEINVHMLTSKTRVAPIKTVSLPRLELCGAVLLSKLMLKVKTSMQYTNAEFFAWSDSTAVLGWIKAHPSKWNSYVGNRVASIQEILHPNQWHFISSEENPADCATRGVIPSKLQSHPLWFNGPNFLSQNISDWPKFQSTKTITTDIELRKSKTYMLHVAIDDTLLHRFSSLQKLIRITAYCFRYINNSRSKKLNTVKTTGPLSVNELNHALLTWIRIVQLIEFNKEVSYLRDSTQVSRKSRILNLNPFISTTDSTLRVGGRLSNSNLSFNEKHPIILPSNNFLTTLIIRNAHQECLHGGTQLTLCHLRTQYWIVHGRRTVKNEIHKCLVCYRYIAKNHQQLMGNLPKDRVSLSRAFNSTGIDYAGPINVRVSKGRARTTYKGFICIFICLATRGVHIEVVSDLTSDAFLAAYYRFVSRRGRPLNIYSDNGKTFVGANKKLQQEFESVILELQGKLSIVTVDQGTTWHFIPPLSPHFGGLWEAGVKSIKHHFKRIVGNTNLTFEEITTLVTRIEGALNSRPICPLSDSPDELSILTPGHLISGTAPLSSPQNNLLDVPDNRLNRWKLLTKMYQDFWHRWSSEYLTRLQQRPKWMSRNPEIKIGDIVLLKDDNIPPAQWPLGRILEKHTGSDNITRVVTLKTKLGIYKRPITKICVLPISENEF